MDPWFLVFCAALWPLAILLRFLSEDSGAVGALHVAIQREGSLRHAPGLEWTNPVTSIEELNGRTELGGVEFRVKGWGPLAFVETSQPVVVSDAIHGLRETRRFRWQPGTRFRAGNAVVVLAAHERDSFDLAHVCASLSESEDGSAARRWSARVRLVAPALAAGVAFLVAFAAAHAWHAMGERANFAMTTLGALLLLARLWGARARWTRSR